MCTIRVCFNRRAGAVMVERIRDKVFGAARGRSLALGKILRPAFWLVAGFAAARFTVGSFYTPFAAALTGAPDSSAGAVCRR